MSHEVFGDRMQQGIPAQNQEKIEQERAEKYWEERLKGEVRIATPQDPRCEFAVVVPVYDEKPERLLRQIESLRNQRDVDPSAIEVIYVVSNDVYDGTERSRHIIAANQSVLTTIQNTPGLSVFVVDKSSPGNEIAGCNVGKTRNRGVAEASLRFHENNKNGVLIQSDADAYFEDPGYLKKVTEVLRQNPCVIGIAGGFVYEFDPDTSDPEESARLQAKIEKFVLLKEWEYMTDFLRDPASQAFFLDDSFSGVNMISRSFETAVVGGLDDVSLGENDNMGKHFKTLAAKRGTPGPAVMGMKSELVVVTALRESDRTGGSFKSSFDEIDIEKQLMGADPLAPEPLQMRNMIEAELELNLHSPDGLRRITSDREGNVLCGEEGLQELISYLRTRQKVDLNEPFFADWFQRYGSALRPRYEPRVPVTDEGLRELEIQVLRHADGKRFIENMRARLGSIRIREP